MEASDNTATMLAEHEFFQGISHEYVDILAPHTMVRTYPPGEYIFRKGADARECYLIRQGQVALDVFEPHRGGAITLQTLGQGKVLGRSWLVAPYVWRLDARAILLTRVMAIEAAAFRQALDADHEFGYQVYRRFLAVFSERLHAAQLQLSDMYA
ncbi:MAG: Crp/Fnr family transcriptional regulator [Candidatus Hydrogenedentota bacterium]